MYVTNWAEANNALQSITGGNHIYGLCDTGNSAFAYTTLDALSGEGMGYFVCPCKDGQGVASKGQYIYIDPARARIVKTIEQYYSEHGQATTIVVTRDSHETILTVAVRAGDQYSKPIDVFRLNHEYQSPFRFYEDLARQVLAQAASNSDLIR